MPSAAHEQFRRLAILLAGLVGVLGLAGPATAQAERIDLRVLNAAPGGLVEVDRGAVDGLQLGDPVVLTPRSGRALEGVITVLEERSSLVEIDDPNADVPAGTRGQAVVPSSRFATETPAPPTPGAEPGDGEAGAEAPAEAVEEEFDPGYEMDSRWENLDEAFRPGMPLLSNSGVAKPEERATKFTGRTYLALDYIVPSEDGREDAFWRLGNDFTLENPFGYGGELHWDGELNYRRTDVPDQADEELTRYRLDRLSYRIGGTRHRSTSFEAGRLLHRGMPEFGFLDGVETIWRTDSGDRYGTAVGLLPEPSPTLESGHDFGVSSFYEWNADPSERMQAAVGYQHTWHNGASDRDLFVLRAHSLPTKGWRLFGVLLLDLYTSGDQAKGAGLELTQANATARREWDDYGLALRWSHQEFPEIDKNDFLQIDLAQLANDRYDRLSLDLWMDATERLRLNVEAGLWIDEEEDGGDGRLGLEVFDSFGEGSRLELAGFLTQGLFTDVIGARASLGFSDEGGRWDVFYELAQQDNLGFQGNNDDILQHRVRVSRDWLTRSGWNLSTYVDGISWDTEEALLLGVFTQKSF